MSDTPVRQAGMPSDAEPALLEEAARESGRIDVAGIRLPRRAVVLTLQLVVAVGFFGFWEIASGRWMDAFWLSSPSAIVARAAAWMADGSLPRNGAVTLLVIAVGMAIGLLPGVVLGMALGSSRFLNRLLSPFLVFLYCVPLIALAPLLILWFGIGLTPKIVIVAVIVFFLVFFNVHAGVSAQDRDLADGLRIMGGSGRDVACKVSFPASLPWIVAGVRIAVPYSVVGAVVGEMIVSSEGLGYLVKNAASVLDSTGVFTAILTLTLLSVVLDAAVQRAERRFMRWSPQMNSEMS